MVVLKEYDHGNLKITVYESYDLIELFPSILEANKFIRRSQIDTMLMNSKESPILDILSNEKTLSDGSSVDDYPLYKVFFPNSKKWTRWK